MGEQAYQNRAWRELVGVEGWLRLPPSRLGHSSKLDGSRLVVGSGTAGSIFLCGEFAKSIFIHIFVVLEFALRGRISLKKSTLS